MIWKPYWKDKTSKYCLYVMVKFDRMKKQKSKTFYVFEIALASDPHRTFYIEKRYSDFTNFVKNLKKEVKDRTPLLPPKMGVFDGKFEEKRAIDLQEWLRLVANEMKYHCREMYRFLGVANPNNSQRLF